MLIYFLIVASLFFVLCCFLLSTYVRGENIINTRIAIQYGESKKKNGKKKQTNSDSSCTSSSPSSEDSSSDDSSVDSGNDASDFEDISQKSSPIRVKKNRASKFKSRNRKGSSSSSSSVKLPVKKKVRPSRTGRRSTANTSQRSSRTTSSKRTSETAATTEGDGGTVSGALLSGVGMFYLSLFVP